MTPSALVLGGRGLLGQALVRELTASGWDVQTLERDKTRLFDPENLTACIRSLAPDVLFNTVAWTQVDDAEDQPDEALAVNRGLPALLGHIVKGTSTHLIHYSTDFVFNGNKQSPYDTDDEPEPQTVYGRTKLAGEKALEDLDLPNCAIVRTAWLFGPGRKNFVNTILNLARSKEVLTVVHDQAGSPTYTPDLARASIELAQLRASGLFHVVNTGQATWCELAAEAVRLATLPCSIKAITSDQWPQKARRPHYSVLNTASFTKVTGHVMRPWVQALRDYIFTDFLPAS